MKYLSNIKRSFEILDTYKLPKEHRLFFILQLIAWQKMSFEFIEKYNILDFNEFYRSTISFDALKIHFKQLQQINQEAFDIAYMNKIKINNQDLVFIFHEVQELIGAKNFDLISFVKELLFDIIEQSIPEEICQLIFRLADIDDKDRIYIPFTYSQNILLTLIQNNVEHIYLENDTEVVLPNILNILFERDINVKSTNILENPAYKLNDAPHLLEIFDTSLSNPPFGLKTTIKDDKIYRRFSFSKGKCFAPTPHIEHILAQTSKKAVIIVPDGFLSRSVAAESKLKAYLIEKNILEAVISLVQNIFTGCGVKTSILILNFKKKNDKFIFIDGSRNFEYDSKIRKNILTNTDDIITWYRSPLDRLEISKIVSKSEIKDNHYNLAVDRYVVSKNEIEVFGILDKFSKKMRLSEMAQVLRPVVLKAGLETGNNQAYEVCSGDIPDAGFLYRVEKRITIPGQTQLTMDQKLQPYDILLSIRGIIGKVAIMPEKLEDIWIPNQVFLVIRPNDINNKKIISVYLYMFLRSKIGKVLLNRFAVGGTVHQIQVKGLGDIEIPQISQAEMEKAKNDFLDEIKIHQDIESLKQKAQSILNNFLN